MMMSAETRLTTTEAARRLGVEPEDVYRLAFVGDLDGHPDADGVVRAGEQVLADYMELQAHVS